MRIFQYEATNRDLISEIAVGVADRFNNLLGRDSDYANKKAREIIVPRLEQVLPDDHALLMDYPLPGLGVEIPMVLVGPSGIRTIFPCGLRGVYRAKGDSWLVMNDRRRSFEEGKTNLVERSVQYALALEKYFDQRAIEIPEVEALMMFSDPSIYVDMVNPAVRIVLRDAIEKFAIGLSQSAEVLEVEGIEVVVKLIMTPPRPRRRSGSAGTASGIRRRSRTRFTRNQWLILAGLVALWGIASLALLAYIISTLISL